MSESLPPGTLTLPELLKKKGFTTAVIGKFFHTTDYAGKQLLAFDRIEITAAAGLERPGADPEVPARRAQRERSGPQGQERARSSASGGRGSPTATATRA